MATPASSAGNSAEPGDPGLDCLDGLVDWSLAVHRCRLVSRQREPTPFCRWQLPGRAALAPHALASAARCHHCGHAAAADCRLPLACQRQSPFVGVAGHAADRLAASLGWTGPTAGEHQGLGRADTHPGAHRSQRSDGSSLGILLALAAAVVWHCRACSVASTSMARGRCR